MKKYHPAVHVVFNPKAYCNSTALLNWFRQQLKWGSPYSPDDHEPKLLVLDSFAPHKNTGTKKVATTPAAKVKAVAEQAVRKALKDELKAQNITSSIIPGGCTAYVQPLDISVNKLMKGLIRDQEEDHWEDHLEEWKAGKFSKADRRILITQWVGNAWETLHRDHKDTIIKTFRQTGLSLNPDGSDDRELKIRDLPGIEVGDWRRQEPIVIQGMRSNSCGNRD